MNNSEKKIDEKYSNKKNAIVIIMSLTVEQHEEFVHFLKNKHD